MRVDNCPSLLHCWRENGFRQLWTDLSQSGQNLDFFLSWMGAARGNEDALMTLSGSPWMEDLKGSKSDLILRLDSASERALKSPTFSDIHYLYNLNFRAKNCQKCSLSILILIIQVNIFVWMVKKVIWTTSLCPLKQAFIKKGSPSTIIFFIQVNNYARSVVKCDISVYVPTFYFVLSFYKSSKQCPA